MISKLRKNIKWLQEPLACPFVLLKVNPNWVSVLGLILL